MLQALLREIARGQRLQTPQDLAQALNTTPEMVRTMAEQLKRQGYLQEAAQCAAGCAECALGALCNVESPGSGARLWSLTEKGRRAVNR
ncbi:MAG: FeoC-like transcriptional regulator [Anaerolineales bacterium]